MPRFQLPRWLPAVRAGASLINPSAARGSRRRGTALPGGQICLITSGQSRLARDNLFEALKRQRVPSDRATASKTIASSFRTFPESRNLRVVQRLGATGAVRPTRRGLFRSERLAVGCPLSVRKRRVVADGGFEAYSKDPAKRSRDAAVATSQLVATMTRARFCRGRSVPNG
jgi:hypothetical protein